ncbi:hypothetical protein M422DRAFT_247143 [Sphaerobolus stellatus SS14]|nr:hypothetical protein M422DRAFT_247143 [Sphaerobolus stellatus SS14]
MPDCQHTPIPPLIEPILHEDPQLQFETFKYHPSYPGNGSFPVPLSTSVTIAMRHVWQPVVDSYWEVVRGWIMAKMMKQSEVIARQEEREEEANRLKKSAEMKRDEEVKRKLKKKCCQSQKSAPTVVESDEEDGNWEARIVTMNRKMLIERGIENCAFKLAIHRRSSVASLGKSPAIIAGTGSSSKAARHGSIRMSLEGRRATCTASNVPCITTGEAIGRLRKGGDTPKCRALGSKPNDKVRILGGRPGDA